MKIDFKIILAALLVAAAVLPSRPARAETAYWTRRSLLADFFPTSQQVSYRTFDLTVDEQRRLELRLGYAPPRTHYVFFVATTGNHVDGYALFDEQLGEHQPITFAVKLSPAGVVERQEIVVYREPRGDEVRDPRFEAQFRGKTATDPVRAGVDVSVISGATISSRSIAIGVKRALVLFDELVAHPQPTTTARR